jgi:hypothetical protein
MPMYQHCPVHRATRQDTDARILETGALPVELHSYIKHLALAGAAMLPDLLSNTLSLSRGRLL